MKYYVPNNSTLIYLLQGLIKYLASLRQLNKQITFSARVCFEKNCTQESGKEVLNTWYVLK